MPDEIDIDDDAADRACDAVGREENQFPTEDRDPPKWLAWLLGIGLKIGGVDVTPRPPGEDGPA